MTGLLLTLVSVTLGLFVASKVLDGLEIKGGVVGHLVVAAAFGIANAFLGRALFVALGIATLGLGFLFSLVTRFVVSALLLMLVDKLSDRLKVKSFGTAVLAALILSVVGTVVEAGAEELALN
jgi:putative membrane protein